MTASDHLDVAATERSDRRRRRVAGCVAACAVVALFAFAVGAVRAQLHDASAVGAAAAMPTAGADAPPLDLATLSPPVEAHYRFAAAHEEAYSAIPCYCGCDEFLAHRSLADCFVRADGGGWDAHGAGCAICQAEAAQARRLLERGDSPAEVRAAVVAEFGPADDLPGTS